MSKQGLFRKALNGFVGALGYESVIKGDSEPKWTPKAIALNTTTINSYENIKKNGLKKPGNISFKVLRQIAKQDALIRICVNVIKKEVSQCDWHITVEENAPLWKEGYKKEQEYLTNFFKYMNTNGENMRVLLDRLLEDLLVLDAWVIEKIKTIDGTELVWLNAVDGATIKPVYDDRGELWDPAYKQFINNQKTAEFSQDELIYMMANPQNDIDLYGYGMSPIESILLQVQASLEADMHNIKRFSGDNVPPGILDLWEMNNEDAETFIATWNATVIGNVDKMKFVWGPGGGKKFVPFQTTNRDMQYSEYIIWLSKIKLSVYGLSGIDANMLQDANRSTAKEQRQITNSRWVKSTKGLVEEYFTRQVIWELGDNFKYLEFSFKKAENLEEMKTLAEIDKIDVEIWKRTPNELRERDGFEKLEEPKFDEELDMKIEAQLKLDREKKEMEAEAKKPKKPKEKAYIYKKVNDDI